MQSPFIDLDVVNVVFSHTLINRMADEESKCKTLQKAKNVLNMSRSLNWNAETNLNV